MRKVILFTNENVSMLGTLQCHHNQHYTEHPEPRALQGQHVVPSVMCRRAAAEPDTSPHHTAICSEGKLPHCWCDCPGICDIAQMRC